MRSLPLVHSFLLCFSPLSACAVSIPFSVRTSSSPNPIHQYLPRQSSTSGVVPVGNTQNVFYYSNITLGGRQISVMLDTGRYAPFLPRLTQPSRVNSSDLWVTGPVPGAQDAGKSLTLSYAVGTAAGMSCFPPFGLNLTPPAKATSILPHSNLPATLSKTRHSVSLHSFSSLYSGLFPQHSPRRKYISFLD